jgi:3-hydroxyisobutyrate dehydrogenase-like beta-hydroxyacid dehydrogenase
MNLNTPQKRIGVIGLGLMGTAMTKRLLEYGYEPIVWNRTREKADSLFELGAEWSDNPLAECDRVIISLYTSDVVESVLGQLLASLHNHHQVSLDHQVSPTHGKILIDTTTGAPEQSVALSTKLASLGVYYLDAPISGSSDQTRRGESAVMVGGDRRAFEACSDLWSVLGANVYYTGSSGSAARMKLVSNLALGLNRAALAEALVFAQAIGVNPSAALKVLRGSMAYSRVMDVKGQKMLNEDFRVQAKLSQHLKDVRLMLATGVKLPLSETHAQLLEQAESMGLGEMDNCAIIKAIQQCQQ